jgi:hypothetical protein
VTLLDQIVEDVAGPVVLVAHSAGVLVTVHWAAQYSPTRVVGALLVTPAAFAVPLPPGYPSIEQLRAHGWLPVPRRPLPFPSIFAVSTDDPLGNTGAAPGAGERVGQPDALAWRGRPPQPCLRLRRVAAGGRVDRGAA